MSKLNKPFKSLTSQELAAWVKKLSLSDKGLIQASSAIIKNGLTGDIFALTTSAIELIERLNIPGMDAGIIFQKMQEILTNEKKENTERIGKAAIAASCVDNDTFDANIVSGTKNVKIQVKKSTTIKGLKLLFVNQEGGSFEQINLYSGGVPLSNDQKLEDYGIQSERNLISTTYRVAGGASTENSHRLNVKQLPSHIKTTFQMDCITLDDSKEECRALMPCGHAVSADTMFQYVKSLIEKLHVKCVVCPVINCGKTWNWDDVCAVADMTSDEYIRYSKIINERNNSKKLKCPHCMVLTDRPHELNKNRVNCSHCKKDDFCWSCGQLWKGKGYQLCGNSSCATEVINKKLQTCPMISPTYLDSSAKWFPVKMPSIRACPGCLFLIEHKRECKHMACPACKTSFCFVCLGLKKDGKWPCGTHETKCSTAPRQQLE